MTTTTTRPVGTGTVLLAGALDQLVFVAVLLLGFGTGLLAADTGGGAAAIGAGIAAGALGVVVAVVVQIRVAVRTGATAGLFLLGLRLDPSKPVHWADDAAEWLLYFWQHLVLLPLVALLDRVTGRRRDRRSGVVHDPRARSGGARTARLLLAAVLVASPVPFVLGVLA